MQIAVGTTSDKKIDYLKEILNDLKIEAEIISTDVKSDVSDQPLTSEETKQDSINRAKKAWELAPKTDMALGIEVGYQANFGGNYEMLCWTTIIDKKGKQISCQSHSLLLPAFYQQILKENKYLGDHVRQYLAENTDPLSQHIGIIIRDRKPFIQTSIELALLSNFTF